MGILRSTAHYLTRQSCRDALFIHLYLVLCRSSFSCDEMSDPVREHVEAGCAEFHRLFKERHLIDTRRA